MRDLQEYKVGTPDKRKEKLLSLISKFSDDATFREWGIEMEQNLLQIKGKKLHDPMIIDPVSNSQKPFREYASRRVNHFTPLKVNGDRDYIDSN